MAPNSSPIWRVPAVFFEVSVRLQPFQVRFELVGSEWNDVQQLVPFDGPVALDVLVDAFAGLGFERRSFNRFHILG